MWSHSVKYYLTPFEKINKLGQSLISGMGRLFFWHNETNRRILNLENILITDIIRSFNVKTRNDSVQFDLKKRLIYQQESKTV